MSNVIIPTDDGKTHINIYSKGVTELGRMLSNFYPFSFTTTTDGRFLSIEGYWYWLGIDATDIQKDALRHVYNYRAKLTGEELKGKYPKRFDNDFERKILKAIWLKVQTNKTMFTGEYVKLPFYHYYVFGNKVIDVTEKYWWMVDGISRMRDRILETINETNDRIVCS